MSFKDTVEKAKSKHDPAKMKGVTATYQFEITGEGGGHFFVEINDGEAEFAEGQAEDPNLTVTMELEDFKKMLEGELNPTSAFMTGKIKIKGDMSLAMKLQALLG